MGEREFGLLYRVGVHDSPLQPFLTIIGCMGLLGILQLQPRMDQVLSACLVRKAGGSATSPPSLHCAGNMCCFGNRQRLGLHLPVLATGRRLGSVYYEEAVCQHQRLLSGQCSNKYRD